MLWIGFMKKSEGIRVLGGCSHDVCDAKWRKQINSRRNQAFLMSAPARTRSHAPSTYTWLRTRRDWESVNLCRHAIIEAIESNQTDAKPIAPIVSTRKQHGTFIVGLGARFAISMDRLALASFRCPNCFCFLFSTVLYWFTRWRVSVSDARQRRIVVSPIVTSRIAYYAARVDIFGLLISYFWAVRSVCCDSIAHIEFSIDFHSRAWFFVVVLLIFASSISRSIDSTSNDVSRGRWSIEFIT